MKHSTMIVFSINAPRPRIDPRRKASCPSTEHPFSKQSTSSSSSTPILWLAISSSLLYPPRARHQLQLNTPNPPQCLSRSPMSTGE
jgi:hypothetical protein